MIPDMAARRPGEQDDARGVPVETDQQSLPLAVGAREASRLASVSSRTWARLVASGRAPAGIRLGRSRRWLVSELRAWLAAGAPPRERWDALRAAREGRP